MVYTFAMIKQRLDHLLVAQDLAPSRTKAAALIMAGRVKVDGRIVDKAGHFFDPQIKIEITETAPYVSRGGEKIASVAEKLGLDFKGRSVLDVGSSTGGFTDFALQNGAKKVYAVDVGTGQLDWRLRNDERVVVMEKTDIRDVAKLPEIIHLMLIDASFISLRRILPAVKKLADKNTQIVAMAKPHFESDYVTASKHKGVIKNDTIRRQILKQVEAFIKPEFKIIAKADSAVLGRKGNKERFYLLQKL